MINRYLNRFLAAVLLLSVALPGFAGLPPTTSKDGGDTTDKATFIYRFPYFSPGTHTGTVFSLGPLYGASGITGVIPNTNTTATSTNTNSAIVTRDGSGNFSFGTGTGSITGHSSLDLSIANNLSDVNSASTSFDNISGMTLLGDIIYGGASGTRSKLAGSTSASLAVLTQIGNGSVSAAPVWSTTACLTNPMAASGDIIYGGASGVPTKLVKATNTNALVLSAGIPAWASMPSVTYGGSANRFSPTITGCGTALGPDCAVGTTPVGMWHQVGSEYLVTEEFCTGTVAGTTFSATLPNSGTLDVNALIHQNTVSNAGDKVGEYDCNGTGCTSSAGYVVTAPGTSTSLVYMGSLAASTTRYTPALCNALFASGVKVNMTFRIPVTQGIPNTN